MKSQFVQVLEVERLELDHFWEIHRQQLEQRDQDTESHWPCHIPGPSVRFHRPIDEEEKSKRR